MQQTNNTKNQQGFIVVNKDGIEIHTKQDFAKMRKAGQLAASILDMIGQHVQVGVTTNALNDLCHNMAIDAGAKSAPLGYKGYPKSICTSVNHVICHGIPNDKKLKDGDTLNIDVTVILDGWYGDTSRMFWVGEKTPIKAQRLTQVTYDAMMRAIDVVRPGATVGDIGYAIASYAESFGYGVVTDFCGHGLGKVFHTIPNILHKGNQGEGIMLEEGMFFTIEPMINIGRPETKINRNDGWTATTKDRSLSAQFEHSMGVTANGVEIFTTSPKGLHCPPYSSKVTA